MRVMSVGRMEAVRGSVESVLFVVVVMWVMLIVSREGVVMVVVASFFGVVVKTEQMRRVSYGRGACLAVGVEVNSPSCLVFVSSLSPRHTSRLDCPPLPCLLPPLPASPSVLGVVNLGTNSGSTRSTSQATSSW